MTIGLIAAVTVFATCGIAILGLIDAVPKLPDVRGVTMIYRMWWIFTVLATLYIVVPPVRALITGVA